MERRTTKITLMHQSSRALPKVALWTSSKTKKSRWKSRFSTRSYYPRPPLWLETGTSRRLHQHLMNTHSRSWSITKFINTQHKNSFNPLHKSQQFIFMIADFLQVSFFCLFTHWFLREKKIIQIWKQLFCWLLLISRTKLADLLRILSIEKN